MWNGRRPTSGICTGLDTRERYTTTVCVWMYVYHLQIVDSFYVVFTLILWQVDLQCRVPGNGGYYYPDHLPVLGELMCACSEHVLWPWDRELHSIDDNLHIAESRVSGCGQII